MAKQFETTYMRHDGAVEKTFVWVDISIKEVSKYDHDTYHFDPPFDFKYSDWKRNGNLICRYVFVSKKI